MQPRSSLLLLLLWTYCTIAIFSTRSPTPPLSPQNTMRGLSAARPLARLPSSIPSATRRYATAAGAAGAARLSDKKCEELDNMWKGTATTGGDTKLYIDGQWVSSSTKKWIDLHDPVRRYP